MTATLLMIEPMHDTEEGKHIIGKRATIVARWVTIIATAMATQCPQLFDIEVALVICMLCATPVAMTCNMQALEATVIYYSRR